MKVKRKIPLTETDLEELQVGLFLFLAVLIYNKESSMELYFHLVVDIRFLSVFCCSGSCLSFLVSNSDC